MQEYHRFWWGYAIILFGIIVVGVAKEAFDWYRLGWHHTSLRDKVTSQRRPLLCTAISRQWKGPC